MKHFLDVLGKATVFVLATILLSAQIVLEYDFYRRSHYGVAALFDFFPEWSYPLLSVGQLAALVYTWFNRAMLKRWWWYLVLPLMTLAVSAALTLLSPEVHGFFHHAHVVFGEFTG